MSETKVNKGGRPKESVPQDIAAQVIAWISQGKTLRDFCRQPGMPSFSAIYDWLAKDAEFQTRFARARESGEDVIAQECLAIADDGSNDWQETEFGPRVNNEHINRSKLRVWTRLQLLSKWNPKKYGEKVAHTGSDGDGPVELVVKHISSDGE
jgi:hypothetical protein